MEIWIVEKDEDGKEISPRYQYKNGKLYTADGKEYKGNNKYANTVKKVLNKLIGMKNSEIGKIIKHLEASSLKHEVANNVHGENSSQSAWPEKSNQGERQGSYIWFNIDGIDEDGDAGFSLEVSLGHELYHSYDFDNGNMKGYFKYIHKTPQGRTIPEAKRPHEVRAVKFGNLIRNEQGLKKRTKYGKHEIKFDNDKIE